MIDKIAKYESSGEVNFRLENKKGAMDAVKEHFLSTEECTKFMDFDGYRAEFKEWWFNIRPSNTEPYLRFICEASSKELLEQKLAVVKDMLITRFGAKL